MRNLIRSPLTWMVVFEMVVVGALIVVAWNVIGGAVRPAVANPALAAPDEASAEAAGDAWSLPDIPSPVVGRLHLGPLPALNTAAGFWRVRLAELNRQEAWLAQLEWRMVHAAMGAARDYVEKVVLPSITRAERAAPG